MTRAHRRLMLLGGVCALTIVLAVGGGTAAQDASPGRGACTPDVEPNDAPETATAFETPICIAGTLPESDQDLFLWTVTDAQATQPWDITVDGVGGTITGAKVLQVTSPAGESPLVIGNQILEVDQGLDALEPSTARDVLLPAGLYLLGIARSATADNSVPVDTAYQVSIEAGTSMPPPADVEPNDDPTTANALDDSFSISGDLRDSQDVYRWTTSELGEGRAWHLRLSGPLASYSQMYLQSPDGVTLATATLDRLGHAELTDLRLPAGDHFLVVYPSASVSTPYALTATEADQGTADPEPNGTAASAVALDPGHPVVHGRLANGDAQDWYSLEVDEAMAASLLDIRLIWRDGPARRLCLADATGAELQCRSGDHGVSLSGLHLSPGIVTLEVSGDARDTSSYLLRIDTTTAPAVDFESEPNDDPRTASVVTGVTMRGQLAADDRDTFRVTTTGEPQLWQMDVTGAGIDGLLWQKLDGTELGVGDVAADRRSAQITDLYLIPGDHWLRVAGSNGDYSLALTPLGPPDPNGEREPNNQVISAEPFAIGTTRTGRLPSLQDADVFRFTVDTADHLRVTVTPPTDAAIDIRLDSGSLRLGDINGEVGAPTDYDAVLEPGDYELWLTTTAASAGRYSLTVEREDPFLLSVDQEPNDSIAQARPLPRSLHIDGDAPAAGDSDWYVLGTLPTGGELTFVASEPPYSIAVSDGVTEYDAAIGEDGRYVISGLPSAVPLWLVVRAYGPYALDVDPGSTGLPAAVPDPALSGITLSVVTDDPGVAAYWASGQLVQGTLMLANTSDTMQELSLDSATSDPDWALELAQTQIELPAGASVEIPVIIRVLPDAALDDAVRLTVRARDARGAQVTGWTTMASGLDATPVAPYQAWSVPDALLGGLNVASAAIGGLAVVSTDAATEALLYDGITPSGGGFRATMSGTPLTLTVDLAGDASIPVAGMILDPLGSRMSIEPGPRAVALLLSDDGVTWQEALSGELSPLTTDQSFVLPEPIPARFAQLRIDSTWGGTQGEVVMGEWKVIASPGAVPDAMPANIAEPVRGGHIVWMDPPASSQAEADSLLTDDPAEYPMNLSATQGDVQTFAIGFQDDRQALLTGLEWIDPVPSDASLRMRHVDVAISTTSPVGPWEPMGTWDLARATDGSVAPFTFDNPTWARFVRFIGTPVKKDKYYTEEPATVRILEAPTTDSYRSVLGEWGPGSMLGPRDWREPPDAAVVADQNDGDDTPETARTLTPGTTAAGRVHREEDVDWYSIAIPEGQNSIRIVAGGVPAVGVSLTLFDEAGTNVPMTFGVGPDGSVLYEANVLGGATYRIRVEQPPFSAVFAFDTSGSMGNYLPFVNQALRAYTGGVTKGDEQVKVQPFEEDPLLPDWSDDPYLLQDAVDRYVLGGGSSSAETALIDASRTLAGREGARAVLLVTDAETSSYQRVQEMWGDLASVRPMIFAVHVGSDGEPLVSRHFMQDWAAAGGGFYQYAVSHGEMDQAFARMATWLRRPAAYTLDASTSEREVEPPLPGTLSVVAVGEAGEPAQAPASKDVAVEIILDTSGSMLDRFGGKSRIDSAKQVLDDLVSDQLPAGAPVALRVLGSRADPCGTRVAVPFGPLDAATVTRLVDKLKVDRAADTPIGAALDAIPGDLAEATGARIVLLITDSKEIWPHQDLCGRDPQDAIKDLKRQGIDARISIVGMAVDDKRARRQMARWAELGGGAYFDARDRKQLDEAIRTAISAPYQVFDAAGVLAGSGTVGGRSIELPPGTYRVVVLSEPPVTYEGIIVESEGAVTVTLPTTRERVTNTPAPSGSPGPSAAPGASPGPEAPPVPPG